MAKQSQQYDKIFKENFEGLINSLARIVLKIDHTKLEEIPDDSQYTVEKRPDFLKKVKAAKSKDDYILQIEIQTTDPMTMRKRMLIYYGFLYHDYELPIKQYVLYIGRKGEAEMPTTIKHDNLNFKFHLVNIANLDHEKFLYSEQPEDIVISILCDFKNKSADTIIETILKQLTLFSKDQLELGKYLTQLEILSNLRNLQELTIKKLSDMSLIYDLETDIRYKQGYEKAKKEAEMKAKEAEMKAKEAEMKAKEAKKEAEIKAKEAEMKFKEDVVRSLLNLRAFAEEYIAETAKTTIEFVREIQEKIVNEKRTESND